MTDRMTDAKIKFARVHELYVALGTEIQAFMKPQPFRIRDTTEGNGELVGRVLVKRLPPREWGAVVGDVVHNLRAALDYLAWQLVGMIEEGIRRVGEAMRRSQCLHIFH